jgi:hypothetical protein
LIKQASPFALSLMLLSQCLLLAGAGRASAQVRRTTVQTISVPDEPTPTPIAVQETTPELKIGGGKTPARRVTPVSAARVSFSEMARVAARNASSDGPAQQQVIHSPGTRPEPESPLAPSSPSGMDGISGAGGLGAMDTTQANAPSPSPAQTFLAQEDGPRIGTTTFTIPPDTYGAVGIDKVFTQTNSNFRIHNKLTGAALETINAEAFWSSTGATNVFDPRVQYDPFNNRWIVAITSNPGSTTGASSVLVGVSETSDPQGDYFLYRFIVGHANGSPAPFANGGWADFPMLGFNKNFVAIGYNMHANTNNAFIRGEILFFDYPQMRTGPAPVDLNAFQIIGNNTIFCLHPATTLSATEENLYLVEHFSSAGGTYVTGVIDPTGAVSVAGPFARTGGGWRQPIGDILPQTCVPGAPLPTFTCPATPRALETQDSQVRGNVIFRNNQIWYAQTVGIDIVAGGVIEHTAAQWTVINPTTSAFITGGRVEDATATPTNGGRWYAYPSLSVNKFGDMLMGFSEFESDDYVDAAYAFRFGTDPAGTMQDPVVYKEGEDYYEKTFNSGRNRFGDYSHTVLDPVNDSDMWTVQEYAGQRIAGVTPVAGNSNDSRWGTWWARLGLNRGLAATGDLVISEFRLKGTNGENDEFIEIYNKTASPVTVLTTDGSAGYALAASDGTVRFTIPNGTVIPARGHYLGVNSAGYSLASYPAGVATTATGDATYTTDIPINTGIALFNTATPANFTLANRYDAVGASTEANTLYREGSGYQPLVTTAASGVEHTLLRDTCGKQGNLANFGPCPSNGFPVDNNDNAMDFYFADTNGTNATQSVIVQRLGAPGPENLSSPIQRDEQFGGFLLDATTSSAAAPNRFRNAGDTGPNKTFGSMELRRRIVNNTGAPVTRLRFRIVDTTTFPSATGRADLRALTSTDLLVGPVNDAGTCGALQVPPSTSPIAPCSVTVRGLTLEEPPAQPNGGGFNSSLSADSVTITPLAPGQSINIRILLGVQASGNFRFFLTVEALP